MSIKQNHINTLHEVANEKGLGEQGRILLTKIMRVESNGKASAKNPNSSATGLFQFIDETWNNYADKNSDINRTDSKYGDGRLDPKQQIKVAIDFTRDNERALTSALGGRPPSAGDLYLAHFAGSGGAIKILKSNPDEKISNILSPKAISANKDIYLVTSDAKKKYFKDFTASDLQVWANRKMDQPDGYDVMSESERFEWRKRKGISSNVPEAFGEFKGFLEIILDVVKAIGSAIAGLFSPSKDSDNISLASVNAQQTPKIKTAGKANAASPTV